MSNQDEVSTSAAPLIEHLIELRLRLIRAVSAFFILFLFCFIFSKEIFNFLVLPYAQAALHAGMPETDVRLIYTAPQEFFLVQVKLAMFGGAILAFPFIAFEIYRFIAPGLYKNERVTFLPFFFAGPVFFLAGASLAYFVFAPFVLWFFLAMQQSGLNGEPQISFLPKVSEYLALIMTLVFSFGLVFQLPVAVSLMARAGIISSQNLRKKRKWAIVAAFVVAGVLTPPDPVSQIGLALPLMLLYELSILSVCIIEKKRFPAFSGEKN